MLRRPALTDETDAVWYDDEDGVPPPFAIDGSGGDIGLNVTPFELGYDLSREVTVEFDDSPLDEAEQTRHAMRLVFVAESDSYYEGRFDIREPLFTKVPSPPVAQWYRDYFDGIKEGFQGGALDVPAWLIAALDRDVMADPVTLLQGAPEEAMLAYRPILQHHDPAVLAVMLAAIPRPLWVQQFKPDYTKLALAAALGGGDEVAAVLAEIPRRSLAGYPYNLLPALLAPTPAERVACAVRTGVTPRTTELIVPWIVATGATGFPLLLRWLDQSDLAADLARDIVEVATRVLHGPGAVSFFVGALDTKAAPVAAQWLREHPAQLLGAPVSPGQAERAMPFLRELPPEWLPLAVAGSSRTIAAAAEAVIAERAVPALDPEPDWWRGAAGEVKPLGRGVVPQIVNPVTLPPLRTGEYRLSPQQVETLLAALAQGADHPLVEGAREHLDAASRDRWAVAVVRAWLSAGGPAKQAWMMTAAGRLGGDRFVHLLTPLIREWPGQSQHKRAVNGLTALRNVGTDAALASIAGIADKVKFAALKKRANEAMSEIAGQRGLTRDQLEDRIVPDGGLDERGRRTFDYGPRQFQVNLTPLGTLAVRELSEGQPVGEPKTTLPTPRVSDDAELAAAARSEFTLAKKTLTQLAKAQTTRFERAMLTGRRWTPQEFTDFIASRPLLRSLLTPVVWGVYDETGSLVGTVRLDEDGECADLNEEPVTFAPGQMLGVVHPIDLPAGAAAAWAENLADFELVPPFRQLDRPVYSLPADQGDDLLLHGLPTGTFHAGKLLGVFARTGWQRGEALDGGGYNLHALQFESAGMTAVVQYSGMFMGPISAQAEQEITMVYLLRGLHETHILGWGAEPGRASRDWGWQHVPWSQAPATLVNEVIATITAIAS